MPLDPHLVASSFCQVYNSRNPIAPLSEERHKANIILTTLGIPQERLNKVVKKNVKADLFIDYLEANFPELKDAKTNEEIEQFTNKYSIGIKVALGTMRNSIMHYRGNVEKTRDALFQKSSGKKESSEETGPIIGAIEQKYPNMSYEEFAPKFANAKIHIMSDIHVGSPWFPVSYYATIDKYLDEILADQIEKLGCLVMLGDILEFWVYKTDQIPMSLDQLLKSDKAIVTFCEKIRKIADAGKVAVFYVVGNHDLDITKEEVATAFGNNVIYVPTSIRLFEQIHVEHAHRYDLANARDPVKGTPVGYWISRMASNNEIESSGDMLHAMGQVPRVFQEVGIELCKDPGVMQYILENSFRNLIKTPKQEQHAAAFLVHSLVHDFNDIVTQMFTKETWEEIDLSDNPTMDMKIVMPDEKDSRTVAQIVKEYAPFVQRFIDERSVNQAAQMFAAGCSNMDYWSSHIPAQVVVFAHTHSCDLKQFPNGKVYANTGSWCDNPKHKKTVVEVILDEHARPVTVQLLKYTTKLELDQGPLNPNVKPANNSSCLVL